MDAMATEIINAKYFLLFTGQFKKWNRQAVAEKLLILWEKAKTRIQRMWIP
jgi:hypothetical protein